MNKIIRRASGHKFALMALFLVLAAALIAGCWSRKKDPNVVLVIIDTLPAGHVTCYGYGRSTTPNLDALAAEGIRFEHAVAASPWTLPSFASIFTGVIPSRHMAGFHLDPPEMDDRRLAKMRPEMITMAEVFRDHGYRTVGFFNNPFVHPGYGLDKGFDTYDYVGGDNLTIRPAPQVTSDAIRWINLNGEKPFFMVVHYFDPHLAYNPPLTHAMPYVAYYQGKLSGPFNPDKPDMRAGLPGLSEEDRKFVVGLYDGEVAAVDYELGILLKYLREKGIYDNSLVIVTADHGEEFWEHGGFEHGHTLFRELLEVPLVMKYPGTANAGQTVSGYVSLLDLFPTVAEFMGWPLAFSQNGVSLYPRGGTVKVRPHVIVAENLHYGLQQQAFYSEGYKLVVVRDTGRTTVYNLEKDPGETKDVLAEGGLPESVKNQVESISLDLEELLKAKAPEAAVIDRETIEKLKSLGYISY